MANTLTPQIAQDLMWRSMTTGAPTSEFDKYGGYQAVASVYNNNGGTYDRNSISADFMSNAAKTVASTGVGNLGILKDTNTPLSLSGVLAMQNNGIGADFINKAVNDYGVAGFATSSQLDNLQKKYDTLNTSYGSLNTNYGALNGQLSALQSAYDNLNKKYTGVTNGGTTSGGGVIDAGGTINGGGTTLGDNAGMGTSGVVYGPDGKSYSSAAAALAAGVTNYTTSRPSFPSSGGNQPGLIASADSLNAAVTIPNPTVGNVNPGFNISNQNQQLFNTGAPRIKLPGAMTNPFTV